MFWIDHPDNSSSSPKTYNDREEPRSGKTVTPRPYQCCTHTSFVYCSAMGKPTKDSAPGKSAKAEDVPDPNTAPSAPPVSEGEYEYYEETDAGGRGRVEEYTGSIANRPLPNIPDAGAPGQSRASALGGAGTDGGTNNALSNLATGSPSGQHETFILRNLSTFKGEYNGTAITDWIQKVDLLIRAGHCAT